MPTFTHGRKAKILANGIALTSYLREASLPRKAETVDVTAFNDNDAKYIGGQRSSTFTAGGMWEGSTAGVDDVFHTALGQDGGELVYLPNGDAAGETGHGLQGIESSYGVTAPVTDVVAVSAEVTACATERIVSLAAASAYSAASTATGVDNAAASTAGYAGYLFVSGLTGGTVAAKVQHSTDNSTYVDLFSFTSVSAVTPLAASERVAAAGSVNRYLRLVVTPTGGTATVWAGVGRHPANV